MERLQVERQGAVVTVTLDQPAKKNAIDSVMWTELGATARELTDDRSVRCVVLTGANGDFCSGADLTAGSGGTAEGGPPRGALANMEWIHAVVLAIRELPMPTIAKVRGVAAGVGLNIALGCDLVVAAEGSRFSEVFARRGLSLDGGGSWLLPRLVGLHKAKELALFADIIDSAEAERIGLVNRVVPDDELDKVVDEWAARLAAGPPIALSQTKRLLNRAFEQTFERALEDESRAQAVNSATKDVTEAFAAFAQKRDAKFEGR